MKVILLEDVNKLGSAGDVVNVADGYARNYLVPKNLAVKVTKGTLSQIENIKRMKATRAEKKSAKFKAIAQKLEGISIDIPVEIGEEDKIFGTVTNSMIADALREKGFDIDKKIIEIETPVKSLGVYNVFIKLHTDVEPKIRLWVVRK